MKKGIPLGIMNYRELKEKNYYVVDKSLLIQEFLERMAKATLVTRPRRFGKTLNMSMLKSFFEIGTDPSLFEGLYISGNQAICEQHVGSLGLRIRK